MREEIKTSLQYMGAWWNRQTQRTFDPAKRVMSTRIGNFLSECWLIR